VSCTLKVNNRVKSFTTIHANLLSFSITHKTGFMPLKGTIGVFFMSKNPHRSDYIDIRWTGPKFHVLFWIRALYSSSMAIFQFESHRAKRGLRGRGDLKAWISTPYFVRLDNAMLASSNRLVDRKMRWDCCVWGGEMWRKNKIRVCNVWRWDVWLLGWLGKELWLLEVGCVWEFKWWVT